MDILEEREKQIQNLGRYMRTLLGREISFDSEGFFWEGEDWSEQVAVILAGESGIDIVTESHWKVLRFFREYFAYHGRAPMNRHLKQGTGMSLRDIEALFPDGIRLGARRLAGLPNPKSCV